MIFKKIIIGIDESTYTEKAIEYGFELARSFSSAVGLVHIVEPMMVPDTMDTSMMGNFMPSSIPDQELIGIQDDFSKRLLESIAAKYGNGFETTQFHEFGSAADAIISCAARFNADLIIIGSHHRSGFDRFFTGSVSEDVVQHSTIPVLVIPSTEPVKEK